MQNKKVNMKTFIKNYMKAVGVVCACMAAFPYRYDGDRFYYGGF